MPTARIAQYADQLVAIRQDLHAHPELAFEEHRTSSLVAHALSEYGYTVERGIAGTGVVATLKCGSSRKSLGLRADMDALPIQETTGLDYASRNPGKMHACGHDGHTAMLLGAARYLAETRKFDGSVHMIFQPAEEDIGGARRMIEEGLFEKYPCDAVFAMHNFPGFPEGQFLFRPGPFMAAIDFANVRIHGRGGHGAMPHTAIDPVVVGASIVTALQTVISRNVDPLGTAVVTVGSFQAGNSPTIIPQSAMLEIGIRSFAEDVRDLLEDRICKLIHGQAAAFGATAEIVYERSYPATVNSSDETAIARKSAEQVAGSGEVFDLDRPFCASEDFAYMLRHRPGCYFGLGNGDHPGKANLHESGYDFNDACLIRGASVWGKLAENFLVH